jgi:CRP-like cAMP-binding protein
VDPFQAPPTPTTPNPSPVRNRLLAALPIADRERVMGNLESITLTLKDTVQKADEPVREVFFPGGGFLSVVSVLEDGGMVEVATVGNEGACGITGALDGVVAEAATIVQGASDLCYRMKAEVFRAEMSRRGPFYDTIMRYSHAFVAFIMQSTACNAVHSVEQRLARWLLMAHDRMQSKQFPLTQEFVAMMLGANRSTVTLVAGTLQRAGLITYHRGQITIVDREKLESASCECYRSTRKTLDSVLTAAGRSRSAR